MKERLSKKESRERNISLLIVSFGLITITYFFVNILEPLLYTQNKTCQLKIDLEGDNIKFEECRNTKELCEETCRTYKTFSNINYPYFPNCQIKIICEKERMMK